MGVGRRRIMWRETDRQTDRERHVSIWKIRVEKKEEKRIIETRREGNYEIKLYTKSLSETKSKMCIQNSQNSFTKLRIPKAKFL